jgi:segregation and condensation protein A
MADTIQTQVGVEPEHKLKLENYYGPLDLLLQLVKEDELDVLHLRVSDVVEQYVAFLQAAKELNMDLAGEFIVLSSHLMLLKSRRLVPALTPQTEEGQEEEEEISIELIRKLLEYKRYKDLAQSLGLEFERMSRRHERPPIRIAATGGEEALPEVDLWQLVKAFARISQQVRVTGNLSILYQDIPIEQLIDAILLRIRDRGSVSFRELVPDLADRPQVIGNLLAMLELCKQQILVVKQARDSGDIVLSLRPDVEPAG